jgi:hypothetical protein
LPDGPGGRQTDLKEKPPFGGRDWAISHPLDNPRKKIPTVL